MASGYYQRLLGLPEDIPAPDYFQLLGLEPGVFDESTMTAAIRARLVQLENAPVEERPVVDHLRRELQRARAMLMDPSRRVEYEEGMRRRRLSDLKLYVERMLVEGVLQPAAERALMSRLQALGVPEGDIRPGIDEALESVGGKRARMNGPVDGNDVSVAESRLLGVMAEVADEQLEVEAGVGALQANPSIVHVPVAETAPPQREVVKVPRSVPAAPRYARQTPSPRRGSDRLLRSVCAGAAAGGAFITGDLLASLLPELASKITRLCAPVRQTLEPSNMAGFVIAVGIVAMLVIIGLITIWLAGREGKWAFLCSATVWGAAFFMLGVLPIGQERQWEEDEVQLDRLRQEREGERRRVADEMTRMEGMLRGKDERRVVLEDELRDMKERWVAQEKAVAAAVEARDDARRQFEEASRQVLIQQELKTRIAALGAERDELVEEVKSLRDEVAELKKKLEGKR